MISKQKSTIIQESTYLISSFFFKTERNSYKEEKPVKQPELFVSYIHAYVNTSLRYIIEFVLSESQW